VLFEDVKKDGISLFFIILKVFKEIGKENVPKMKLIRPTSLFDEGSS
jgi:hypothetical protein